jgi:hypothetical protein
MITPYSKAITLEAIKPDKVRIMLNAGRSTTGYKRLARDAEFRECITSDQPLSEVVVDFRSRLFMYIRTRYVNRPLKEKVGGVFRAIRDLEGERAKVFNAALALAKREVSMMKPTSCTYVFGSRMPCPYKEGLRLERDLTTARRLEEWRLRAREFMSDMLDAAALLKCTAALESYMIADLDGICSMHAGDEWLLVPGASCVVPGKDDMFESDRTCARLGERSAVLSEDLDCVALFGAGLMVKEVYRGFFTYTTLGDVMDKFRSTTRKNLAEKCCLMGTDYNLGLKGVGPVKVLKIDPRQTTELCRTCLHAQSINLGRYWQFLLL